MGDDEVFWDTTAEPGSPDYIRQLLDSLWYCEHQGDVGDVALKLAKDFHIEFDWNGRH